MPDLLVLPPRTDLHNHPLVVSGSIFLQVTVIFRASNGPLSTNANVLGLIYAPCFYSRGRQVPWLRQPLGLNQDGR